MTTGSPRRDLVIFRLHALRLLGSIAPTLPAASLSPAITALVFLVTVAFGCLVNTEDLTWMFNATRGSVLIVTLYHASQNAWANLLDTTPSPGPNDPCPFILAVALMWVIAVLVIAVFGPARLSRKPASELPFFPLAEEVAHG